MVQYCFEAIVITNFFFIFSKKKQQLELLILQGLEI